MIAANYRARPLLASLTLAGAALFLPTNPLSAQEDCLDTVCEGDAYDAVKAKRKGGWREGRSPEERMQQSRAAEIAADAAQAALYTPVEQDYEPSPAIWKLADEDTTIYLFGTFHILPRDFRWRSEAFDRIVLEAEELIVETSDKDGSSGDDLFVRTMIANILDEDRRTISERLSEESRPKWRKVVEMTGVSLSAVDRMPLFLSMMGVGLGFSEKLGSMREYGVETVLEAEFENAGKPIGSIEDGDAVLAALLGIDESLLIRDLEEGLSKWDGETMQGFFESMDTSANDDDGAADNQTGPFESEHNWARGELEDSAADMFGQSEGGKQVYKVLLIDRNRAWAEWLDNRLDRPGTILVAVGAAHFEGPDSVQVMLDQRQLTAERIH